MRQRLNLLLVLAVAGTITYFSLIDAPAAAGSGIGGLPTLLVLHGIAYFGLAAALLLYFHDTRRGHVEAIVAAAVFGAGIELVQGTLPARSFGLVDAAVNLLGASFVLLDHHVGAVHRVIAAEDAVLERVLGS